MSSDDKTRNETDTTFSFGVRELRQRETATQQLACREDAPLKAANEQSRFGSVQYLGQLRPHERTGRRVGKR